jgi:hypothetical protein
MKETETQFDSNATQILLDPNRLNSPAELTAPTAVGSGDLLGG